MQILVDCSGDDNAEKSPETAFQNKKTALLQIVEQEPVAKTIIFCNKVTWSPTYCNLLLLKTFWTSQSHRMFLPSHPQIETCRKVENIFKRFDRKERQLHVLPFHAALDQESRLTNMKEFTSSHPEENSLFLVCTDRYFVLGYKYRLVMLYCHNVKDNLFCFLFLKHLAELLVG